MTTTPFVVAPERIQRQTMSDVLAYFKAMRSSGEIDRKDRAARFWGDDSGATVDARGGWLDASGDTSKFLSHLTYTSTMSPQQIPLCAWAMLAARDELAEHHPGLLRMLGTRLRDEALWGADFLMRFRSPEGYFYTGIFDALTKDLEERVVTAPLQNSVRTSRYQAGYRQGGGLAIAALARASTVDDDGDFTRAEYLQAAQAGFEHLEKHNLEYLFDGTRVGAGRLHSPPRRHGTSRRGRQRGEEGRLDSRHGRALHPRRRSGVRPRLSPDTSGPTTTPGGSVRMRPAARSSTPLNRACRSSHSCASPTCSTMTPRERPLSGRCSTSCGGPTPYRIRSAIRALCVQPLGEEPRESFFFPHANETGYWWQGENAAIASLSTAASACARIAETPRGPRAAEHVRRRPARLDHRPESLRHLHVAGPRPQQPDYASDFPNFPGGIVNGITAGWTDEQDIAFLPADAPEGDSWRWAEQWIPHTAWFLLATASAR